MKNVLSDLIIPDQNGCGSKMPILGWVNPSPYPFFATGEATAAPVDYDELYRRYQEYRDAGFTTVFAMGTPLGTDDKLTGDILNICDSLGLGCLLIDGESYARPLTDERLAAIKEFVKPYPAFKGLMAYDEPNRAQFEMIAGNYKRFKKHFPDKLFYVNLLPNYATDEQLGTSDYATYVSEFAEKTKLNYLTYDNYPFVHFQSGIVNNDKYFKNLSVVRRQSLISRIPFMVFVEVTAFIRYTHIPNREELLWQINTALAYGAKGFQYFTYAMPKDTQESFSGAIIARDGTRTAAYDAAREVNAQIHAVSAVLSSCRSVGVIQTGTTPLNELGNHITLPKNDLIDSYGCLQYVRGGNTLTGCFDCDGYEAFYLVNNDFNSYSEVELEFSGSVTLRLVQNAQSREVIVDKFFRLVLNAGEGILLQRK